MPLYTKEQLNDVSAHTQDTLQRVLDTADRRDVAMLSALDTYRRAVISEERHRVAQEMHGIIWPNMGTRLPREP